MTILATSRDSQSAVAGVVLLNKPFGVLCQFSGGGARPTLRDFAATPDVYPAGRLDADSEGLVVLTTDGALQARITDPRHKLEIAIAEGRDRQIRRMTAAVGLPTLRLIRWAVGRWTIAGLAPGESRVAAVL